MARGYQTMVCANHASSNWPLVVSRARSAIKRRFDWFLFLWHASVHLLHSYIGLFLGDAVLMQDWLSVGITSSSGPLSLVKSEVLE